MASLCDRAWYAGQAVDKSDLSGGDGNECVKGGAERGGWFGLDEIGWVCEAC